MEIKDLTGISEPLKKLIDVVSKGIGRILLPRQIKRIADAKVYEIEQISDAIRKNKDTLNLIEYDNKEVKIICEQQNIPQQMTEDYLEFIQRASNRLLTREIKRQQNIDNTIYEAANKLYNENSVSPESVDEDWIARFFNIVEDISNEQMQRLWGHILSGEIIKPKTYSLRTLEILRNILPHEAEIFQKVGKHALRSNDKVFLHKNEKFLKDKLKVDFTDLLLLRDLGLLFPNDLEFSFAPTTKDQDSCIIYGSQVIVVQREADTPKIRLAVTAFTQTGKELLNLIDQSFNIDYVNNIAADLKNNKNIRVYYGSIKKRVANNVIEHNGLIEI